MKRIVVLLAVTLCAGPLHAQGRDVAFVVAVRGPWLVEGQPVKRGQRLQAGAHIWLSVAADFSVPASYSISVHTLDDQSIERICTSKDDCALKAFQLPATLVATLPFLSRLSAALQSLVTEPERYAITKSRGRTSTAPSLPDGVLRLENQQLALGPLFSGIAPRRYTVRLRPVEPVSRTVWTVEFDWDTTRQTAVAPNDLSTGVYLMSVTPSGEAAPDSQANEAWVLVESPARFLRANAAFQEALTATRAWRSGTNAADVSDALRAYLDYLAEQ
jgi:hypothetical protein